MDGRQLIVLTQNKNALDKQLIPDGHRLGWHPFVKVAVLISGDKDFVPLAKWLVSQNKRVIVIGRRNHVNQKLRALALDDTYAIEDLRDVIGDNLRAA